MKITISYLILLALLLTVFSLPVDSLEIGDEIKLPASDGERGDYLVLQYRLR